MYTQYEIASVPVSHYDDSMLETSSMYDNMPYQWNPDINIDRTLKMVTGNIIKAYRCKIDKPYEVRHEGKC